MVEHQALMLMHSCQVLTIICYFLLIGLYIKLKEHHYVAGKLVITISICDILFFSIDIFVAYYKANDIPHRLCFAIAFFLYFIQFGSLLWTTVMAYDICHKMSSIQTKSSNLTNPSARYLRYSMFAWLMTIAVCFPALIIDCLKLVPEYYRPRFAKPTCYTNSSTGYLIFVEGPFASIILVDCIILAVTMRKINKVTDMSRKSDIKQQRNRFYLCIKLIFVMGISEALSYIEYLYRNNDLLLAVITFACLRGVFIFLIFGWKHLPFKYLKEKCFTCITVKQAPSKTPVDETISGPETESTKL